MRRVGETKEGTEKAKGRTRTKKRRVQENGKERVSTVSPCQQGF